jgi:hypothetical protein
MSITKRAEKLCNHMDNTTVSLPARCSPSTSCQPTESLSWSRVSRQMVWETGSYHTASQVTRFDPFRFLSMEVRKGLCVPNEGGKCGCTASQINCSLWNCYTSDAAKHMARGRVSSGHLSSNQGRTCGALLRTMKLGNFLHLSVKFPCIYLYNSKTQNSVTNRNSARHSLLLMILSVG